MRKRRDRTHPIVINRKQKLLEKTSNKSVCPAFGLPSYLPDEDDAEDAESITSHKNYIVAELRKRNPDRRKIDASMVATFSQRRREIVKDNSTVADIIKMYPALCDCQQVSCPICDVTIFLIENL